MSCLFNFTNVWVVNHNPSKHERHNKVFYDNFNYGNNLYTNENVPKLKSIIVHTNLHELTFEATEILIEQTAKHKIIISTSKDDVLKIYPDAIFITTSNKAAEVTRKFKSSGVVIVTIIKWIEPEPSKPKKTSTVTFTI